MLLPAATAAALAGQTVRVGTLAFFDFLSGEKRYWTGARTIQAGGHTWIGGGALAAVSDIPQGAGLFSEPITFTFSGVDPFLRALALGPDAEVYGRDCQVFGQCFDEGWQPLDGPFVRFWGEMEFPTIETDGPVHTLTLKAESIALDKWRAPNGNFSHLDQTRRFPGDLGLIRLGKDQTIRWP